jgi:hypothetical protein
MSVGLFMIQSSSRVVVSICNIILYEAGDGYDAAAAVALSNLTAG